MISVAGGRTDLLTDGFAAGGLTGLLTLTDGSAAGGHTDLSTDGSAAGALIYRLTDLLADALIC